MRTLQAAAVLAALLLADSAAAFTPGLSHGAVRPLRLSANHRFAIQAPRAAPVAAAHRAPRLPGRLSGLAMQTEQAVTPENPLKVIVAGGGVGGLFLAKALQKQGMQVTVLEKTGKFARFGGPIQLASNALATIKGIDEDLFDKVMKKFTFTGTRTNGIKDGIRTQWYTKFEAITKAAEFFSLPYTGVIDRPDLQELLLNEVGGDDTVIRDAAVERYENLPGGGVRVFVRKGEKADKSSATLETMEADVLVGSDGIWSQIRSQMWNQDAKGPNSGTTYSGYTCFAGDTIQKTPYYFDVGYQVYIGPGKYFVTSDVGRGRTQWYAFLALPEGSKSRASNKEYLADLFSKGPEGRWSEEIFKVLDETPEEIIEQRDLFDRPPSVLKSWATGNVVMIGDAVHPMMPNLGQGGCQAIEDAYVLAQVCMQRRCLRGACVSGRVGESWTLTDLIVTGEQRLGQVKDRAAIKHTLQMFYLERLPRTAICQGLSRIASDLIVSAFDTPYQPPWVDDRYGQFGGPLKPQSLFTRIGQPLMSPIFYSQVRAFALRACVRVLVCLAWRRVCLCVCARMRRSGCCSRCRVFLSVKHPVARRSTTSDAPLLCAPQFGYLYTFHPKQCSKPEIEGLVSRNLQAIRVGFGPARLALCIAPKPPRRPEQAWLAWHGARQTRGAHERILTRGCDSG